MARRQPRDGRRVFVLLHPPGQRAFFLRLDGEPRVLGVTALAMVGVSTPVFFLGAISLYFFAYKIHIFPNTGYVPFGDSPTPFAPSG